MRYPIALILAVSIGVAASAYTPSAQAAGVYFGVNPPVPVYGRRVIAVPPAPFYYRPAPFYGAGFYFGGYRGYFGRGYYGYAHPGFRYRAWGYRRR